MRPIRITLGPLATADADGICQSQTPAGAGAMTINGALATGGVATMDAGRRVLITTAADETTKTFTITGTNWFGVPISETIAGVNNTTTYSTLDFETVTSVTVSAATAGAILVGTNGIASSPPLPLDMYANAEVALQVDVTGTVNYTVQQTLDNVFDEDVVLNWFNSSDSNVVGATGSKQSNYAYAPASS